MECSNTNSTSELSTLYRQYEHAKHQLSDLAINRHQITKEMSLISNSITDRKIFRLLSGFVYNSFQAHAVDNDVQQQKQFFLNAQSICIQLTKIDPKHTTICNRIDKLAKQFAEINRAHAGIKSHQEKVWSQIEEIRTLNQITDQFEIMNTKNNPTYAAMDDSEEDSFSFPDDQECVNIIDNLVNCSRADNN